MHQIGCGGFEVEEARINLAVLARVGKWHGKQKWCVRVEGERGSWKGCK